MQFYCPSCQVMQEAEPTATVTTNFKQTAYKAPCPVCQQDMASVVAPAPATVAPVAPTAVAPVAPAATAVVPAAPVIAAPASAIPTVPVVAVPAPNVPTAPTAVPQVAPAEVVLEANVSTGS